MKGGKSGLWQYLFGSSKDVANSTNTLINPSNLTTEELDAYITKLEKTLSDLWEVENTMSQSDNKKRLHKKLDRHRQISDTTLALEDAKKQKNRNLVSSRIVTGTKTYGKSSSPMATMMLTKLAFDTKYDVCSDDVKDFKDYKKFYILEDKGKYYHWLYIRTNKDDYTAIKPESIPITFTGNDKITGTAVFKVNSKTPFSNAPQIRITDTNKHYTFGIEKGKAQGEFKVNFISNNTPFKNMVEYIKNFELLFEYSEDGTNWIKAGSSKNELYITWKQPNYRKFEITKNEASTMQVKCQANRNKENILESLLWWGCYQAKGLGNKLKKSTDNEEQIVDAFFKMIATRKVTRKREGTSYLVKDWSKEGLGYWRNSSSTRGTFARGIRNLIKEGEARCGEWSELMAHLCLIQGIINYDKVAIATHDMAVAFGLPSGIINAHSKTHTAKETKDYAFTFLGLEEQYVYIEQPKYHPKQVGLIDVSLASNGFKKELILVKNCSITSYSKGSLPNSFFNDQKSAAQGNDDAINIFWDHIWFRHKSTMRFYDASYGQSFASKKDSTLKGYCNKMLDGLYFKKHLAKGKNLYIRHRRSYLFANHDFKVIKKNMQVYLHTTTDTI